MSSQSSKRWCFTTNNYLPSDVDMFKALKCKYIVIGDEIGESGTPHLQGFVTFDKMKRLAAMKKICPKSHWSIAREDSLTNSIYCKKDNTLYESGDVPKGGSRSDLTEIYAKIKDGMTDLEIADKYPEHWTRYYKAFNHFRSLLTVTYPEVTLYPLRPWQQELNGLLNRAPDDRVINFFIDTKGNTGKSWFSKYYASSRPGKVQILKPGRKADMAYELRTDIRVLIMDCPRSRSEVLDYEFLESLKDQMVFSGKYDSKTKKFERPIHVCVFMNEWPDMSKLSEDRYNLQPI